MSIQALCPFLFCCCCVLVLYVFCILTLYQMCDFRYFPPFCGLPFYSDDSVSAQSLKIFMKSNWSIFSSLSQAFGGTSKKSLPRRVMKSVPSFSSESFILFALTFRSWIHFQLTFVYFVYFYVIFVWGRVNSTALRVDVQFSQHHLLQKLSFPLERSWHWSQSLGHVGESLLLGSTLCRRSACPFLSGPLGFAHSSFVVGFEAGKLGPPALFFLRTVLAIRVLCNSIGILGWIFSISAKSIIGILIAITLNLCVALGSIDVFTILIFGSMNMGCVATYSYSLIPFRSMFF